jgi:hypothetical protein
MYENTDPIEDLKRRLEETRLPPEAREYILAQLPPPEERERLLRQLKERGGLSAEEFFASLNVDSEECIPVNAPRSLV